MNEQHPEARCEECGGQNVTWFAPSEIWNKAAGDGNGILCPVCFVRKAEAVGIRPTAWKVAPEEHAVASEKPAPVPKGMLLVDEILFQTILKQLTADQHRAVSHAEGLRLFKDSQIGATINEDGSITPARPA